MTNNIPEIIPFQKYFIELVRSSFSNNVMKSQVNAIHINYKNTYLKMLEELPTPTLFYNTDVWKNDICKKKFLFDWVDVLYLQHEFDALFLTRDWNKHIWDLEFEGYETPKEVNGSEQEIVEKIFKSDRKFNLNKYKIIEYNLSQRLLIDIANCRDNIGLPFHDKDGQTVYNKLLAHLCYIFYIAGVINYENDTQFCKDICKKFDYRYEDKIRQHFGPLQKERKEKIKLPLLNRVFHIINSLYHPNAWKQYSFHLTTKQLIKLTGPPHYSRH